MITGIIANPNMDEKDEKSKRLEDLEEHFKYAIAEISGVQKEPEVDFRKDPFFAAMRLPKGAGPLADLGNDIPTIEDVEEIADAAERQTAGI